MQNARIFLKYSAYPVAGFIAITSFVVPAIAQTALPGSAGRGDLPSPVEPILPPLDTLDPQPLPSEAPLEVAPVDTGNIGDLAVCAPLATTSEPSFIVTEIKVLGSTQLEDEIAEQVDCYLNQSITLTDLLTLRARISQLYVNNGYMTSGAFLPNNQDLTDGEVEIQVVEGQVEAIQVNGLERLREGYVRSRIARAAEPPLNQDTLQTGLQLLQLDPNLSQVNAELTAGSSPGLSLLILDVQETPAFEASLGVDNYRAPSIGSTEGLVAGSYRNLLGLGDRASGSFNLSEGLNLYDVSYELPFNASNGTLRARFSNSHSRIVEDDFEELDIRSEAKTVSVGVRQPLFQQPEQEFALGLDFDWRRSRSFLLDDLPFSFSEGPEDGESQVSVLRFYQDWVKRDSRRVLAARSQFSLGLDAFGATVNDSGTDGRFFAWQGQMQWVERMSPRLLALGRLNGQLTPDSLLPLERFSLGGVGTVRGYAQNGVVSDNAVTGSLEFRVPVSKDPSYLQLTPFLEGGVGWNNEAADPEPGFLLGTGLGLRWQAVPEVFVRLDYGIPLVNGDRSSNSLQESGFYFSVGFQPEFF